jgi:hypothetical protein
MATQFDPYLQWLGIRDPQRPPNHYRLLGLELFENDASVIAMSADRQMAHLRNFKTGPEADVAERLLNELSAARICLLKVDRKAAYDTKLRAVLKPPAPARPQPVVAVAPAKPALAPVITAAGPSTRFIAPPAKAAWKPWAILAGLVILCVGLTALLISRNPPEDNTPVAVKDQQPVTPKTETKPKPQTPAKPVTVTPVKTETTPDPMVKPVAPAEPKKELPKTESPKIVAPPEQVPKAPVKPLPEVNGDTSPPPAKQPPPIAVAPNNDLLKLIGEEVEAKAPAKAADPKDEVAVKKPEPAQIDLAPPVEQAKLKRVAVPDKAAIAAKEKEVREIFAEEHKSQKPEVKAALATKLRQSSADSKGDPAMRYVLLSEARNNAILGGSVKLAVEITEELISAYDVSAADERSILFKQMLSGGNIPAAFYQQVMEELRKSVSTFQAEDEYEAALKLVSMGAVVARNKRDNSTVTELAQRVKEIGLQKTAYARAKVAKETLAKNPADPAANEAWGTYVSFTKGDFPGAMPFLSRAAESENLASLAKRELAANKSPAEQLSLADEWWAIAEKLKDVAKSNVRLHSAKMYRDNFSQAKGLDAAKIEKRLKEVDAELQMRQADALAYKIEIMCKQPWKFEDGQDVNIAFFRDGRISHSHLSSWSILDGKIFCRMPANHGLYNKLTAYLTVSFDHLDLDWMEDGKPFNHDRLLPAAP